MLTRVYQRVTSSHMTDKTSEKWLRTDRAAERIGCTREALLQLKYRGQGPPCYQPGGPGGTVYWDPDEIDDWIRSGKTGLEAAAS